MGVVQVEFLNGTERQCLLHFFAAAPPAALVPADVDFLKTLPIFSGNYPAPTPNRV